MSRAVRELVARTRVRSRRPARSPLYRADCCGSTDAALMAFDARNPASRAPRELFVRSSRRVVP